MEHRLLRYFVAVAEELHFGRAAERLHMSQPPLSQQIRGLEEDLGVRLFNRTSRNVTLTPEGAILLQEARAILSHAEAARERVKAVARGQTGMLRVGFVGVAMEGRVPAGIRAYREAYPGVRLELREAETTSQLQDLQRSMQTYDGSGRDYLDAGFVFLDQRDEEVSDLAVWTVLWEPFIAAVSEAHPLARKSEVHVSALSRESLLLFPRKAKPTLYDDMLGVLRDTGGEPVNIQETSGGPPRVALAAAGIGVALVPASEERNPRSDVRYLRVVGDDGGPGSGQRPSPLPMVHIGLVWRRDDPCAILARFVETLRTTVGDVKTD